MLRLGVNIDHVATLRQARGGRARPGLGGRAGGAGRGRRDHGPPPRGSPAHPGPRPAAAPRDGRRSGSTSSWPSSPAIVGIALEVRPDQVTLRPRTARGADDRRGARRRRPAWPGGRGRDPVPGRRNRGRLFIDPEPAQVEAALGLGVAGGRAAHRPVRRRPEGQLAAASSTPCSSAAARIVAAGAGTARRARPELSERRRRRPARPDGRAEHRPQHHQPGRVRGDGAGGPGDEDVHEWFIEQPLQLELTTIWPMSSLATKFPRILRLLLPLLVS